MNNVAIIGSGPSGLFCALQLLKNGHKPDEITIFESGLDLSERIKKGCIQDCKHCSGKCNVLHGFGGAGGFSDGKINISSSIGGDICKFRNDVLIYMEEMMKLLSEFIGSKEYEDEAYLTDSHYNGESTIYHIGSDGCKALLSKIFLYLKSRGVNMAFGIQMVPIKKTEEGKYYIYHNNVEQGNVFDNVVLAVGRSGNSKLHHMFENVDLDITTASADVGIRVELPAVHTNHLTDKLHEFKFRTKERGLEVRTFCVCPNGFVSQERIDGVTLVNGYSNKNDAYGTESELTNFAVLAKIDIEDAANTNEYALDIARMCDHINGQSTISQRMVDFMLDRKTTEKRHALAKYLSEVTYLGANGNLNYVIPLRIADAIKEALSVFSAEIPKLFEDDVWVHGIEAKCYSNRVEINENFEVVGNKGAYAIGDGSGWTRGLAQSIISGLISADNISKGPSDMEEK